MKQILLIIALVGCGKKEAAEPQEKAKSTPKAAIEAAIRSKWSLNKPTGELTEADLEKVTYLDLENNQLTDVKGLEKLTQLEQLVLHNNQLTEPPEGLEKLTQLKSLVLALNQLTDVKGLEKLTQLGELHLSDNPALTKAQIAELQKALPNCIIHSNPTK